MNLEQLDKLLMVRWILLWGAITASLVGRTDLALVCGCIYIPLYGLKLLTYYLRTKNLGIIIFNIIVLVATLAILLTLK